MPTPTRTLSPPADAVEKYGNDHGTHVAGIAAGKTVDADGNVTFAGQSPEAQLAIFKVFSDSTNGASTDTILAALNDALLLDVDVINMSLGSNGGFGREAEGDLTTKYYDLVKASGILLNCSAGNSYSSSQGGAHGDFTSVSDPDTGIISSSSSYDAALSVASVNANETAAFLIGEGRVPYNDVSGHSFTQLLLGNETSKTYEYVMVPNNGDVADYQGPGRHRQDRRGHARRPVLRAEAAQRRRCRCRRLRHLQQPRRLPAEHVGGKLQDPHRVHQPVQRPDDGR